MDIGRQRYEFFADPSFLVSAQGRLAGLGYSSAPAAVW